MYEEGGGELNLVARGGGDAGGEMYFGRLGVDGGW